jgi:2-methylcitrate dehydratase PrpD
MGTTQRMAQFISEARFEDIPRAATDMAKLCLLDAVGCAVYGTTRPLGKIITSLVDELGGTPTSRVLGTSIRTNSPNAALANGTLGHAEDFDDMGSGAHQAVLVMPVVLALGEELGLSGQDAITAYCVGFETTARISLNMGHDHYGKGWHSTSSAGTMGSTAAAAKCLGLDEQKTRYAIGLGASQAAGLRGNFGTQAKPFHPGNACRSGVMAAKLAQKGYLSNPSIIEDRFGYAAVLGEEMTQLANMSRNLGNPWAIMGDGKDVATGILIKIWPCCGGTHAANTCMLRLVRQHHFTAADVQDIFIETTDNPSCMAPNLRWPKSGLEGKFSTWYTVASIAVDGKLDLANFTDEAASRPAVQDMLKRVTIKQLDEYAGRPNRSLGGEVYWDVNVRLKNGQTLSTRAYGHGDTYGWAQKDAVLDKFRMLAGEVLPKPQVDQAVERFMALEQEKNVRDVVNLVVKAASK